MSENTILLTQEGYDRLSAELEHLTKTEKPDLLKRLAIARSHGDLSENAEYHAVKERKAGVETRILELNSILNLAQVFAPDAKSADGTCVFGATVTVDVKIDGKKKPKRKFKIVSEHETDTKNGLLSMLSPLGNELIGKTVGEEFEVEAPAGTITYKIAKIDY